MKIEDYRDLVSAAEIFKISLGEAARFRRESLDGGCLVFLSGKNLLDAIISKDELKVERACREIKTKKFPTGNPSKKTYSVWCREIRNFIGLHNGALVIHWDSQKDVLYWGITTGENKIVNNDDRDDFGQINVIFHRPLLSGWQRKSLAGGKILSNIHPKARDFAINPSTFNRVDNNQDYFRALILGEDLKSWESRPTWLAKANKAGWRPFNADEFRAQQEALSTPLVVKPAEPIASAPDSIIDLEIAETADYVMAEIRRMADTAMNTAANANGQTVEVTVKNKDIEFSRQELVLEIDKLLKKQGHCCALTGYKFVKSKNVHLKMSLDRIDSNKGYVKENLQVVTRAANFYKSASDPNDWALKVQALMRMARAIQEKRKAQESQEHNALPYNKGVTRAP